MRSVSRRVVESLGFLVTEAENGQEALARCAVAMPDLILLDWNMPVMNGIEFLKHLRQEPGGDHPIVVFCTVENDVERIPVGNLRVPRNDFVGVWAAAERRNTEQADRGVTDWYAGRVLA